ncbi:MAG: hydrogenase maturation factor [Lachnospiraceae bacterium]|nr:hydrogenase maturation factor [Lachnospiraceae bacterium]
MRTGKVPENVLKRSVLKEIKNRRKEVIKGAEAGADYALLRLEMLEDIVVTTNACEAGSELSASLAIYKVGNNIACAGAVPVAVTISIVLPVSFDELQLKKYMRTMEAAAEKMGVEIVGGDTKILAGVSVPVITVTGMGKINPSESIEERKVTPGQELVVTKWIGMEGALLVVDSKEEELKERYSFQLLDHVKAMEDKMMVLSEAATAIKSGASAMHDLSEGGILAGLWEFGQKHGVGLEIDLKKIPVKQEIIEICEFYELNPYGLRSGGSMLIAADHGSNLVRDLNKIGIEASVIGRVTGENDRIIKNGDETRYLDLPQADEVYKMKF